ncbi:MAG: hypothetical protein JO022_04215 [Acidobacteriaceae bacterium]|nr:hypothetical protein [Acidobacteriaceae bacterium]
MDRFTGELEALFDSYKTAVDTPEPGVNFMPKLWDRIEARRRVAFEWRRVTRIFVGSAAAICLAFAGFMIVPDQTSSSHPATYVDALAEAHPTENLLAQGISRVELPDSK